MKNKFNPVFFIGVLVLLISIFYLLGIIGIDFKHFLIFSIGVIMLAYSIKYKLQIFKYISCLLIIYGALRIITIFPFYLREHDMYYNISGLIALLVSFFLISKNKLYITFASVLWFVLTAMMINNFITTVYIRNAYILYTFTIMNIFIFLLGNKITGYIPLLISIMSYLFATNNMLVSSSIITLITYKLINLMLLIISAISIFIISKRKISKEN